MSTRPAAACPGSVATHAGWSECAIGCLTRGYHLATGMRYAVCDTYHHGMVGPATDGSSVLPTATVLRGVVCWPGMAQHTVMGIRGWAAASRQPSQPQLPIAGSTSG